MYQVEFYHDKNDFSDIVEYLDELYDKGKTSKTARINHNKIMAHIDLLETHGTYIGEPVVKHISNDIWELRPLRNRIMFFYWKDKKFILLSHFIKKSNKTPQSEIGKAQARIDDHIERYGE